MTNSTINRIKFDLVGESIRGGKQSTRIIGSGEAFIGPGGLSDKTRFVLNIWVAPVYYGRCALVPRGESLPSFLHTSFRVCDSGQKTTGGSFKFGIGRLMPSRGIFHKSSYYYLLEPDKEQLLWQCGQFVAYLDPRPTEDFFTFSEASSRVAPDVLSSDSQLDLDALFHQPKSDFHSLSEARTYEDLSDGEPAEDIDDAFRKRTTSAA